MLLVALKPHSYNGKTVARGEIYEANGKFATALVRAGISQYLREPPLVTVYEAKEFEAEPLAADKPVRQKRQYKRRDMNREE